MPRSTGDQSPKRINIISESGILNCRSRVYGICEWENADLVSDAGSWKVGAERGRGGGRDDEKPEMDQRTIQCSRSALERMRSWWNLTLGVVRFGTGWGKKGGGMGGDGGMTNQSTI